MLRRTVTICSLLFALATAGVAQDDLRDVVTRDDGREIRGRVRTQFAADEIEIRQGGKRIRVPRARIAGMRTVDDLCAEFAGDQRTAGDRPEAHFVLAQWARTVGLAKLAEVQAIYVLTLEPDHRGAHEFLGHREHPRRGWLWPDGRKWRTRAELDAAHDSWGKALELDSEHFRVRTDAGIAAAATALLDLEHLHAVLRSEFGEALDWLTALEPMELRLWSSANVCPPLGNESRPYFQPRPFGDFGATWVDATGERPEQLFTTGTQMILYRCVAGDPALSAPTDRLCATLELGFARWMESRMAGPPGRAAPREPGIQSWQAEYAQNERRYSLANLLHLTLPMHFYGSLSGPTELHWSSAQCFLTFLLDPRQDPPREPAVMRWMSRALRDGLGDSSTAFDAAFGTDIESLEQPFRVWLDVVGRAPRR